MTNGPGKSDRPTVPEKSPNNAGQLAAEGMEGRGLAKGNLPQQNVSRTPVTGATTLYPQAYLYRSSSSNISAPS
jgi:hypothetical protein